jgi:hypothetical protein
MSIKSRKNKTEREKQILKEMKEKSKKERMVRQRGAEISLFYRNIQLTKGTSVGVPLAISLLMSIQNLLWT